MKTYRGIRYARADRFALPQLEPPLSSLDNLQTDIKVCPQNPCRLDPIVGRWDDDEPQSEDCLRLSIHTPSTSGPMPVLVWIHGGAYLTGSGLYSKYDPTTLSEMGQIVVVNISYRLASFGFLYDPENMPENLGIADQVCALRWVNQNIHLFGGNPDDVTLLGQSAGGYSILHHIANLQQPLFSKAIITSAPFSKTSKRLMRRNTQLWLKGLGKDPKTCSVHEMLQAQQTVAQKVIGGMPFSPLCDDILAPRNIPPQLKAVKLWCQQDDALAFVPLPWLCKPVTNLLFLRPMKHYAQFLQRRGVQTSFAVRTWRHGHPPFRAIHCMDLPLIFGNYDIWKNAPFLHGVDEQEYQQMATQIRQEIIQFVKR